MLELAVDSTVTEPVAVVDPDGMVAVIWDPGSTSVCADGMPMATANARLNRVGAL